MSTSLPREIRNSQATRFIPDLLQSLFAMELIMPSDELWLISPWISDIPILDNRTGEFASLVPEWDRVHIRLSQVLCYLADHSAQITVATRTGEKYSQSFLHALEGTPQHRNNTIRLREAEQLHEKGLLGRCFFLSGSFNFTFHGITMNEEIAHLYTDPATISENRIALSARWNGIVI